MQHGYRRIFFATLILLSLSLPSALALSTPQNAEAADGVLELKDGALVSGDALHQFILIKQMIPAITIQVNTADKTVKSNYTGNQSASGGGWNISGNINWTMTGTYSSSAGISGQYSYKADITGTNPAGTQSTENVFVKGSFTGPPGLAAGKYTISFAAATGRVTANNDTVKPWSAAFNVYETGKGDAGSGGIFSSMSGKVEIRPDVDKSGWKVPALKQGETLPYGTHVRTGPNSTATLRFPNGATFVIGPNSEFMIDYPSDKDKTSRYHFPIGGLKVTLEKKIVDQSLEIDMDQTMCEMKGTTLTIEALQGQATVKVIEGIVGVKSKVNGKSVDVTAGKMVTGTSAGLSPITSFDVSQEQARWQDVGTSTSSLLLPQGNTSSQSQSSSPSDPSRKKIKIGPLACFIATAAYGSETAEELYILRAFRDRVLLQSELGKLFVYTYYQASPPLAAFIAEHDQVRTIVRESILDPVVNILKSTKSYWNN